MKSKQSLPMKLQQECGGSFAKTVLLQKRVRELVSGSRPLIDAKGKNYIEIALLEMQRGLISLEKIEETEINW